MVWLMKNNNKIRYILILYLWADLDGEKWVNLKTKPILYFSNELWESIDRNQNDSGTDASSFYRSNQLIQSNLVWMLSLIWHVRTSTQTSDKETQMSHVFDCDVLTSCWSLLYLMMNCLHWHSVFGIQVFSNFRKVFFTVSQNFYVEMTCENSLSSQSTSL